MDALPCTILCKESKHYNTVAERSLIYYDVRIGSVKMYITPLLVQNIAILYTLQSDLMSSFARQSHTLHSSIRATKTAKATKVKNNITDTISLQTTSDKKTNTTTTTDNKKNRNMHAASQTSHNTSQK